MAAHRRWLLMSFLFLEVILLEAAKILTISTLSASHYIVISRVSQVLHEGGHNVTKLLYESANIPDFRKEKPSYQVINWRPPEDQEKKFADLRHRLTEEITYGRSKHHTLLKIHQYFGDLCSQLLSRKDIHPLPSFRLRLFLCKWRPGGRAARIRQVLHHSKEQ